MNFRLIFIFFIVSNSFSQSVNEVLFTINDKAYYTEEFLNVYRENFDIIADKKHPILEDLNLFIDFKLKVTEAENLGLDTLRSFKNELKQYKNQLALPYLKDEQLIEKLVKEAYDRLKYEINVSHILIFLKLDASPTDTLNAYNKLLEARKLIINGADFSSVAKKYSEDPTVEKNGGDLGFFKGFQMVYSFEDMAYKTALNEVSLPFKTKFGYHIVQVNEKRPSKGAVEVAHILINNNQTNAAQKIDSLYQLILKNKATFTNLAKDFSDDKLSAAKGGKLNKFGVGEMMDEFANVAFSIENEGEISKPFKTMYGWHIVKLLKKYPVESFEALHDELTQRIKQDERSDLISKSIVNKLLKQYKIIVNEDVLSDLEGILPQDNSENLNKTMLKIEDMEIKLASFMVYLQTMSSTSIKNAFNHFMNREILNYYKNHLEFTNQEFAATLKKFKEGLLLFEISQQKVWEKSKEMDKVEKFYIENKQNKYGNKSLQEIKGKVISDYQHFLEQEFLKELHNKYEVKFNESEKRNLQKLKF